MKKTLIRFLGISSLALLMLASCKKNDAIVTASMDKPGNLTASTTSPVLDRANLDDTTAVITFNYTASQYDAKIVETNTLQIDADGDNWQSPVSFALTGKSSQGINTSDLNTALLKIIPGGTTAKVNVRIQHALSGTVDTYSNVITLTVTPFKLAAFIYAAGAFEGWTVPSDNMATLTSATANNVYVGLINFPAGSLEFKILPDNNDYNGNYGAGATAGTITQGDGNPPNIVAPGAFYYQVTVDLNQKTISYVNTWSIIGDATPGGWDTDTDMSYDASTKTWFTTVVLKSDGTNGIKFRYLHDWTINLGGAGGTLSQDGPNITIPATAAGGDTYKITLDPVADTYTLTKQ